MQAFLVPCFCAVEVMEFPYASLCLPHPLALRLAVYIVLNKVYYFILFFLLGYSCFALLLVSAVQGSLF